jgi:hypothetical protein
MKTHTITIRLSKELKSKAKKSKLNITSLLHDLLCKFFNEKKCPTCGQKIKEIL